VAATLRHFFGVFKHFAWQRIEVLKTDDILKKVKNININMLTARKIFGLNANRETAAIQR